MLCFDVTTPAPRLLHPGEVTAWSKAETEINRVCAHYGQSCLSMHDALVGGVQTRRPNFALEDVAGVRHGCMPDIVSLLYATYLTHLLPQPRPTHSATNLVPCSSR